MRSEGGVTYLTAEEMAEMDRAAIEDFGMDVLVLMENAGRAVAVVATRMLGGQVKGRAVTVLAGKGNNGGDGLAAARHLHDWGANVTLVLASPKAEARDAPAKQLEILEKMGLKTSGPDANLGDPDLLVDALLGYGSRGPPREPVAGLIRKANASGAPILAVDIPSGLDATTGEPNEPCIVAKATVTFGLPKTGFLAQKSRAFVGELYVADISVPLEVYRRYSQAVGLFEDDSLFRVW